MFPIKRVLICVMLLHSVASLGEVECPKRCTCSEVSATVKCVNANMTSIPPLPAYATLLIFRGNKLNNVTSSTFKNILNMSLERLFIPRNDIHSIEANAFSGFKMLRFLDLSINKNIPVDEMVEALSSIKSNLTAIRLDTLYWNDTNMELVYKALSRYKIKTLYMNNNRLQILNFTILNSTLPHLEFLDASFCSIRMIVSYYMRNLKRLLLKNNIFILLSNPFGVPPDCFFPNLKFLRLDSNDITYLDYRFKCLDKVETLMLDRNSVIKIHNDTFSELPSLKVLTLSNLGNHVMLISAHAFRSKSLESLDLKHNKFPFTENPKNFRFDKDLIFKSSPKLSKLDLGGNYIQLNILRSMLLPLRSLKELSIESASLTNLPTNLFYKLSNLYKLNLSKNKIIDWDGIRVFGNKSISLRRLNLSNNSISAINETQFPDKPRFGLSQIDLRHNPFSCSCRNLWFTKWIDGNQSLFRSFPNDYICKEPANWANKNLSEYRPTNTDCIPSNKLFMYIVASLSVTGIVFTVVLSLVYKARWHIRYWIYLLHFKKKGYTRIMDERDDYKYDAFVVYCDSDRRWIYSKLSYKVEKEHGIKLCIHHRDFEGGKLIADNIAEHMADSRKVLIAISRKMVKSEWCLFETRVAQEKFLNKEQGALVIILLDDLPKSEMPSSLKFLVNSTTYIQLPEQETDEERFWQDVVQSLQL